MNELAAINELLCRAAVYRLLARLWKQEVDAVTLEELQRGAVHESYIAAGGSLPEAVNQATLDALAVDFCQLFLGPTGHLPPYQSVWSDGQFHTSPVVSVRRYLQLLDAKQWDQERMLDHLSVELAVMASLLERLQQVDRKARHFDDLAQVVVAFFREHVAWAKTFCKAAHRRAQTEFYRSLFEVTADFLDSEVDSWYCCSSNRPAYAC